MEPDKHDQHEGPKPSPAAQCSAAALLARITQMRERRKHSSNHYSVRVDELIELLDILETIIRNQERQSGEPPNIVLGDGR